MIITIELAILQRTPSQFSYIPLINGDISQNDGQTDKIGLKQLKKRFKIFGKRYINIVRDLAVHPSMCLLFNAVIRMIASNSYFFPTTKRASRRLRRMNTNNIVRLDR